MKNTVLPHAGHSWLLGRGIAIRALLVCITIVCCGGCHPVPIRKTNDCRIIPLETLGSSLQSIGAQPGSASIHFDSLYVYTSPKDGGATFLWLRFWPDGRVVEKGMTPQAPTLSDGDDLTYGRVGLYCVQGNTITVELYLMPTEHWLFATHHGRICDDGSILFTEAVWDRRLRLFNEKIRFPIQRPFKFHRKIVGEMTTQPDW